MTNPKTINLDNEIKQCSIVKPYEALQSEFAKKLIAHLASKSKFKEQLIKDVTQKLEDETQTLTPDEGIDFLEFLNENIDFFNEIIKRYKGQFPAWIQSGVDSDTLDMEQKDHVLYRNGKYLSLDKIKNYVRSRIKGQHESRSDGGLIESLSQDETERFYRGTGYNDVLYKKFTSMNYSYRINKNGIVVHNLNGIMFTSMETQDTPYGTFSFKDLNYPGKDYSKGKSFSNLQNHSKFAELLKKSDAKAFESIEQSNKFHFKLIQAVADQLGYDVTIDTEFFNNLENNEMIENILWCFHALTNIQLWIPFQFDEKGIASIIYCIYGDDPKIFHPDEFNTAEDEEETYISLLLEIDPSKEKKTK